jgi:hypothetical protein
MFAVVKQHLDSVVDQFLFGPFCAKLHSGSDCLSDLELGCAVDISRLIVTKQVFAHFPYVVKYKNSTLAQSLSIQHRELEIDQRVLFKLLVISQSKAQYFVCI